MSEMASRPRLPLSRASQGEQVRLVAVRADSRTNRRLAELGLTPGVMLGVLQGGGGPVVVTVRGTRVALGRETAAKIEVARLP